MSEETTPIRLYVEGRTDYEFFMQLLIREKLTQAIWLKTYGGTTHNLKTRHLVPLKTSSAYVEQRLKVVAVVTDADQYPDRAFQSVQTALQQTEFTYPAGTSALSDPDGKGVRTAILVLPDKDTKGSIENLFLRAFKGYEAMQCLEMFEEDFQNCLIEKDAAIRETRVAKAKYQMFLGAVGGELSAKDAPKKKNWFPWDSSEFDAIKAFLRMLADSVNPS